MPEMIAFPPIMDLAGIAVFALSGALAAARERQTFVTLAFFALITGVGGGTVRDLLIGAPVFWVGNPLVAPVCLLMAILVWFIPERLWPATLLEWTDAAGLSFYAAIGTVKALHFGLPPGTAIIMGIITGCAGGIVRDMVAGRPSIIMRPELYVTAAALSAAIVAAGLLIGISPIMAGVLATVAGLTLRGAAIQWSLSLPAFGHKSPFGKSRMGVSA